MKILLINHYAGSPQMGMEYRPYYLAKEWLKAGHQVSILLANRSHIRQHNPDLSTDFFEEDVEGIKYIWVDTPPYEGNGLSRVKNIFSFVRKTYGKAKYLAERLHPDVLIASSTYPSDNYVAHKIAKIAKAKYIFEVHDLWPLSPMELGNMSKYHPFIMAMQHGENFAYKKADAVISMLPKTKEHMAAHGLDLQKWHYVPNGVSIEEWGTKRALNTGMLRAIDSIRQTYDKIIAYTGTYGLANALQYFVMAAQLLPKTAFVLVGKGPEKSNLEQIKNENNIENVFIFDGVHKLEIPHLLSQFDYLYIGLKYEPLFRFGISPNKLIDYMAAAKPIIQAIDAGNNMVAEAKCGISIEPENPKAIVEAICKLNQKTDEELKEMGKNGREFVLKNHDYSILANKMIDIFKQ